MTTGVALGVASKSCLQHSPPFKSFSDGIPGRTVDRFAITKSGRFSIPFRFSYTYQLFLVWTKVIPWSRRTFAKSDDCLSPLGGPIQQDSTVPCTIPDGLSLISKKDIKPLLKNVNALV